MSKKASPSPVRVTPRPFIAPPPLSRLSTLLRSAYESLEEDFTLAPACPTCAASLAGFWLAETSRLTLLCPQCDFSAEVTDVHPACSKDTEFLATPLWSKGA